MVTLGTWKVKLAMSPRILLFSDNSVLKSLLSALTRTENAPVGNEFHKGALNIITFLVVFAGISLKRENGGPTFSSIIYFHPCHPLQQTKGISFNA